MIITNTSLSANIEINRFYFSFAKKKTKKKNHTIIKRSLRNMRAPCSNLEELVVHIINQQVVVVVLFISVGVFGCISVFV